MNNLKFKYTRIFTDINKEVRWLESMEDKRLVKISCAFTYHFEPCEESYYYEYVYFRKSSKELDDIIESVTSRDEYAEFVYKSREYVLFRKAKSKGVLKCYEDDFDRYCVFHDKYETYVALAFAYLALAFSQILFCVTLHNALFVISGVLMLLCGLLFFLIGKSFATYVEYLDDGNFKTRYKDFKSTKSKGKA